MTRFGIYLSWLALGSVTFAESAVGDPPEKTAEAHWSLEPLPAMEAITSAPPITDGAGKPIDRFIARRLQNEGLSEPRRALPHRQLRRLSLMLTGLPPDPSKAAAFNAAPSDEHYAALVEHYLASPQFGERWARHWMDVVRYAETWGYEWNHLIREAWRYRDYLIRAFNRDLPYDQLIREHIAGDLLDEPRLNESLGLNESLIGGAFYRFAETGHDDCVLYPEISLDVMDNQIDTLSKAFQGLTVSCSRCHDHKFDEIPQSDYYALLGIMASSRQVIRTLDLPHRQDELKRKLQALKEEIRGELGALWTREAEGITAQRLNRIVRPPVTGEDGDEGKLHGDVLPAVKAMEHPLFVWGRFVESPKDGGAWEEQWEATLGVVLAEEERREAFKREHYALMGDFTEVSELDGRPGWGWEGLATEGGGGLVGDGEFSVMPDGPLCFDSLLPAGFYTHALSQKFNAALRSPLLPEDKKFVSFQGMGERNSVCRSVIANCTLPYFHTHRFNTSRLAWKTVNLEHLRKSALVNLRSYLEWATVMDDQGYPKLMLPKADYQKTLDNPRSYFGVTRVYTHDVPQPPAPSLRPQLDFLETSSVTENMEALAARYRDHLLRSIGRWERGETLASDVYWLNAFIDHGVLSRKLDATETLSERVAAYRELEDQARIPSRIVGMADQDDGFDVPMFAGGLPGNPGKVIPRSYLSRIEPLISKKSKTAKPTGSGRRRLAELIAHPENPLTARVMANRIWHHLFGHGLVRSVDNFGKLGDRPSHPELLDYLARRLVDSEWSVKALIREIVRSQTFRQSSAVVKLAEQTDPENRLFHRYPSRRLEAEVIRDAMLWASGRLDPTMYGPSIDPHRNETVDQRKLYTGPLDGEGRRSLYLKVTRMGPSKILELFNFPDPSMTRGRRDLTNVPAQALGLLNHPFVHQQAEVHAQHFVRDKGTDTGNGLTAFEPSLDRLFRKLFSRLPTEEERRDYAEFFEGLASDHGMDSVEDALGSSAVWKDVIHTLYNLKEFTYVL